MECAGIHDQRLSRSMLLRNMGVAVKHVVEMIAAFEILEETFIVAMNPGQPAAVDFEVAERLVEGGAAVAHSKSQTAAVRVAVPPNEMRRETLEEPNRFVVFNVA